MKTRRDDLVEVVHGVAIADPFRWLEDGESEEVRAWDDAQNAETDAWMRKVPGREDLRARLRDLLSVGHVGAPVVRTMASRARRYFHIKREGAQQQSVLYVRDGADAEDRVLIDPAPLSTDGTSAIDWWSPSCDGARVAWGLSEGGSEESTLRIRDVASGADLDDRIPNTRHSSVAWLPGGAAFFYTRYPALGTVPAGDEKYFGRVYHHRVGDDPARDAMVFGEGREKLDVPSVVASPNGRWLVVRVHLGWHKSEVWLKDLARESPWMPIAVGTEALYEPMPLDDVMYVVTNEGAPRYRLFEVDYAAPQRPRWREVVPESQDVLADVAVVGGDRRVIVASYLHEASARIERFSRDGASLGPLALPTLGSAGVSGAHDGDELFVQFTSFALPWRVLRADLTTGATTVWDRGGHPSFERERTVGVSMLYATSRDGTTIPMFVVQSAGPPAAGARPAILYGYGGFNIAQTPAFSARTLLAVEQGATWVVALLRGGGEFGEDWHRAGMLDRKQNVFDDLYACAEALVAQGVAPRDKLGVVGGSNGGLLIATAITQRPELFRAGLCLVPLADMLRYHRLPHRRPLDGRRIRKPRRCRRSSRGSSRTRPTTTCSPPRVTRPCC